MAAGRKRSTPNKAGSKRKSSEDCEEAPVVAVPDQELPPRLQPMPVTPLSAEELNAQHVQSACG